jgi:hypothetical protein
MPAAAGADRPFSETLEELRARQTALIKQGQDVLRELDAVTARIAQRQTSRTEAAARYKV